MNLALLSGELAQSAGEVLRQCSCAQIFLRAAQFFAELRNLHLGRRQLLCQRAVLPHPLAHFFDALKVHHLQCRQGRVGILGCKETQLVALLRRLILGKAAEGRFLLGAHHDIEHRFPTSQLHAAHLPHGAGTQCCPGKGHELPASGRPDDTEHPFFIVKLPHQVNDEVALPCKGPVGTFEHIAGELAARLLQGRNGTCRRHAACGAALGHIPVSADLLQLLNAAVAVAQAVPLQTGGLGIPVFGIVDTNSDPTNVDFVIPANDDATKSVEVILDACCAAMIEGLEERKAEKIDMEAAGEAPANKGKKKSVKARLDKSDEEAINAAKAAAFIKEDEEA